MSHPDPAPPRSKLKLSRLRDIGWTIWDPIGLMPPKESWEHKDGQSFADEYDNYLIVAAGQLRRGVPDSEVINYLVQIETENMGMSNTASSLDRAKQVVAAIHADKELWT